MDESVATIDEGFEDVELGWAELEDREDDSVELGTMDDVETSWEELDDCEDDT